MSVFGVILIRIFPHSDWIRTRITPNTDTFHVVCVASPSTPTDDYEFVSSFTQCWNDEVRWTFNYLYDFCSSFFSHPNLSHEVQHHTCGHAFIWLGKNYILRLSIIWPIIAYFWLFFAFSFNWINTWVPLTKKTQAAILQIVS